MFCRRRDITVWKSAWMTSAQIMEPTSSLAWADVIHVDFQTVISRRLQNISTYLFCTAERMLRTIIMQNSGLILACFPIKIDEVRIDRFRVRYDWWRRLQPTSSVSPVCRLHLWLRPASWWTTVWKTPGRLYWYKIIRVFECQWGDPKIIIIFLVLAKQ